MHIGRVRLGCLSALLGVLLHRSSPFSVIILDVCYIALCLGLSLGVFCSDLGTSVSISYTKSESLRWGAVGATQFSNFGGVWS
ncbi:hypothetical protein U1Q18_013916 [Sarracenia purpurea var. burkii]